METSYTNEAAFILAMLLNKFYVLDDIKFCIWIKRHAPPCEDHHFLACTYREICDDLFSTHTIFQKNFAGVKKC